MAKKLMIWLTIASLLVVLFPAPKSQVNAEGALSLWTENAMIHVYRTSTIPDGASNDIHFVSAKNEYENAQIAVRYDQPFEITSIQFSDLVSDAGSIVSSNLKYHFVEYESNIPREPDKVAEVLYPLSKTPDPLSNDVSIKVAANSTQPIFINSFVPKDAAAGIYSGTATLKTTIGDYPVQMTVEVANVTIPDPKDSVFTSYNWAFTNGYTFENYDMGEYYYGIEEEYSPEWWALMDKFATTMVEYRQNMVLVRTKRLLLDGGSTLAADGTTIETFNWTLFDQFVQLFLDKGIRSFGGVHLVHDVPRPVISDATDDYLEAFLPALKQHLEDKGWTNIWYQHVRDEPSNENYDGKGSTSLKDWEYLAKKVQQYAPGMKTMDAGDALLQQFPGLVHTYVPITPTLEDNKEFYQNRIKDGFPVWAYTCVGPQPPWLNRFTFQPTLTGRLLFWNLFQNNVTGHLHWGWNVWWLGFLQGDNSIVYPDAANQTVKSSIRYEAQRDGIEEYELLKIVQNTNPKLAQQITDQAVASPTSYTLDPNYVKTLHDYLVKAAAGTASIELPQVVSPFKTDVPGTVLVNNNDPAIHYTGNWVADSGRPSGKDVNKTETNGDYFEYTFNGTGIDLITEKGAELGKVEVYIDGVLDKTVEAYEEVNYSFFTLYSKSGLSAGMHTIKVVKVDGMLAMVDALRVYPKIEMVTINDNDPSIIYKGNFGSDGNRTFGDYMKDVHYLIDVGDAYEVEFEGTGIDIVTELNTDMGQFDVYIDGVLDQTIECFNTTRLVQITVYKKRGLSPGKHTLKAVHKTAGKIMLLDALRIEKVNYDITKPVTAASLDGTGNDGWFNRDVAMTLTATDDVNGETKSEYSADGGATWIVYSEPVSFEEEGEYAVSYRSIDAAGNLEESKEIKFAIDKTVPTVKMYGGQTYYLDQKVLVVCTASDDGSGLVDSPCTLPLLYKPAKEIGLGTHSVTVEVQDKAGNIKTEVVSYTIEEITDSGSGAVAGVSLDNPLLTLTEGDAPVNLTATVYPLNAVIKEVSWSSDNTVVASVYNGKVTPLHAGTAVITVTTAEGNHQAVSIVTVKPAAPISVAVTGVTLNMTTMTLTAGGAQGTLVATVQPANASNKGVVWTSDKPGVLSVQNGVLTPLSAGIVTITATTEDGGFLAKSTITVNPAPIVTPDPGPGSWSPPTVPGSITIPAGGSGTANLGIGASVIIPAGATNEEMRITISKIQLPESVNVGQMILASPVFEMLKSVRGNFKKAVTIKLQFDPSLIKDGKAVIFYYDESAKKWVEIGGTVSGNTIEATVDHFTKFAVFSVKEDTTKPVDPPKQDVTLKDIQGHWGKAKIEEAVNKGIANGYPDQTFHPDATITRTEFAQMMVRALQLKGEDKELVFTDKDQIPVWARKGVSLAVQAGLLEGYEDGTFRPAQPVTRAEIVLIAAKALKLNADTQAVTGFVDDADIPQWAKAYVVVAVQKGIVEGRENNQFAPKDKATRAEAIVIILRLLEQLAVKQ